MWCRLIIEGNAVYEVDEECMKNKNQDSNKTVPGEIKAESELRKQFPET